MKNRIKRLNKVVSARRLTALFVALSMLLTSTEAYAFPFNEAVPTKVALPEITIPQNLGSVEETWAGSSGKTVVYIQDAHDSLEAQKNIAGIIQQLVSKEEVDTVFEEGYEGPVPTEDYFGFMTDPEVKQDVSYYLLDKLRIGGAEYAHINRTRDFRLIGADSLKLHAENIAAYQNTLQNGELIRQDLAALAARIKKLVDRRFPSEMKDWIKLKERFDRHEVSMLDYMNRSFELVKEKKGPQDYPTLALILSSGTLSEEEAEERLKTVDVREAYRELGLLEDSTAETFLQNETDKKIFDYYRHLELLKRMTLIEITAEEYEAVKDRIQDFDTRTFARFVAGESGESVVLSKLWEEQIQSAVSFYETAHARDAALARALKDNLNKTAVLVFGGFHKGSIKEILKRNQISYIVVAPHITEMSERHRLYYRELMQRGYKNVDLPGLVARATQQPTWPAITPAGSPQDAQFRTIIRHAAETVAFMREQGIEVNPQEMDLIWTRSDLRENTSPDTDRQEAVQPGASIPVTGQVTRMRPVWNLPYDMRVELLLLRQGVARLRITGPGEDGREILQEWDRMEGEMIDVGHNERLTLTHVGRNEVSLELTLRSDLRDGSGEHEEDEVVLPESGFAGEASYQSPQTEAAVPEGWKRFFVVRALPAFVLTAGLLLTYATRMMEDINAPQFFVRAAQYLLGGIAEIGMVSTSNYVGQWRSPELHRDASWKRALRFGLVVQVAFWFWFVVKPLIKLYLQDYGAVAMVAVDTLISIPTQVIMLALIYRFEGLRGDGLRERLRDKFWLTYGLNSVIWGVFNIAIYAVPMAWAFTIPILSSVVAFGISMTVARILYEHASVGAWPNRWRAAGLAAPVVSSGLAAGILGYDISLSAGLAAGAGGILISGLAVSPFALNEYRRIKNSDSRRSDLREPAGQADDSQVFFSWKEREENFERRFVATAMRAADGNRAQAAELLGISEGQLLDYLLDYGNSLLRAADPALAPQDLDLTSARDALLRGAIREAIERARGNQAEASRLLGMDLSELNRSIKQLGITLSAGSEAQNTLKTWDRKKLDHVADVLALNGGIVSKAAEVLEIGRQTIRLYTKEYEELGGTAPKEVPQYKARSMKDLQRAYLIAAFIFNHRSFTEAAKSIGVDRTMYYKNFSANERKEIQEAGTAEAILKYSDEIRLAFDNAEIGLLLEKYSNILRGAPEYLTIMQKFGLASYDVSYGETIREIHHWERIYDESNRLQDPASFQEVTAEFKRRIQTGEPLDSLLPEAFAVFRAASKKAIDQMPSEEQLLAALAIHKGTAVEMEPGEGKTLSIALAAYLHALEGRGVHIHTFNSYLAIRDAQEMGHVYHLLGLSVGMLEDHDHHYLFDSKYVPQRPPGRRNLMRQIEEKGKQRTVKAADVYKADITYGVKDMIIFDYLRDHLVDHVDKRYQRFERPSLVVLDEGDATLLDESGTPLILTHSLDSDARLVTREQYIDLYIAASKLTEKTDFEVDVPHENIRLFESGVGRAVDFLKEAGFDGETLENFMRSHDISNLLRQALLVRYFNKRNEDYIIRDGQVVLVDEFTGRVKEGHVLGNHRHQFVVAKEMFMGNRMEIPPTPGHSSLITYQNYYRFMKDQTTFSMITGTIGNDAEEIRDTYGLPYIKIPKQKASQLKEYPPVISDTIAEKNKAVLEKTAEVNKAGNPILIFVKTIAEAHHLKQELKDTHGIEADVIDGLDPVDEVESIALSGEKGRVTIATSVAGRGVNIPLSDESLSLGGLVIIMTRKSKSKRIDDQAKLRAARRGAPGEVYWFLSREDESFSIFGGQAQSEEVLRRRRRQILFFDDALDPYRRFFFEARDRFLLKIMDMNETRRRMLLHPLDILWQNYLMSLERAMYSRMPDGYLAQIRDGFQPVREALRQSFERVNDGGSFQFRERVLETRLRELRQGDRRSDLRESKPDMITDAEYDLKRQSYSANLKAQRENRDGLDALTFINFQMRDILLSATEIIGVLARDPEESWKARQFLKNATNSPLVISIANYLEYRLSGFGPPVSFDLIRERLASAGQLSLSVVLEALLDTNAYSPVYLREKKMPLVTHYDAVQLEKYFSKARKTLPASQEGEAAITDLWFVYDPALVMGFVAAHKEQDISPHAKGGIRFINPAGQNGHYSEGRLYSSIYQDPTRKNFTQRGVIIDLFDLVRAQETKNILGTKFHGAKAEYTYMPGAEDDEAFKKFAAAFIDGGILAHEVPGPDIGMSGQKVQLGIDEAKRVLRRHLETELEYFKLLVYSEVPEEKRLKTVFRISPEQLVQLREEYKSRFSGLINPLFAYEEVLDLIEKHSHVRFLNDRIARIARTYIVRDYINGKMGGELQVDAKVYESTDDFTRDFYAEIAELGRVVKGNAEYRLRQDYQIGETQYLAQSLDKLLGAVITGGLDSQGAIDHVVSAITAKGVDVAYRRVKDYLIKMGKIKEGQKVRVGYNGGGDVGGSAAVMATRRGDKVVWMQDYFGAVYFEKGFSLEDLQKFNTIPPKDRNVMKFFGKIPGAIPLDREELFAGNPDRPVDVIVTAATANTINENNVDNLINSGLLAVVEGGNNTLKNVSHRLAEAGIPIAWGSTANPGGVIASGHEDEAKHRFTIDELTRPTVRNVKDGKPVLAAKRGHVERVYIKREKSAMKEPVKPGSGYIELTDSQVTEERAALPDLPLYTYVDLITGDRPGNQNLQALVNNIWVGDVDPSKEFRQTLSFDVDGTTQKLVIINGEVKDPNPAIPEIKRGKVDVTYPIRNRKYQTYRYVGDIIFAYQTLVLALQEPGNPARDAIAVQRALSQAIVDKKREIYTSEKYRAARTAELQALKDSGYVATPEEMMHIASAKLARAELLNLKMDEEGHIVHIDTVNPFTGEPIRVTRDFEIVSRSDLRSSENLEELADRVAPVAANTLDAIELFESRRNPEEHDFLEGPPILFQTKWLGALYPPMTDAVKSELGAVEITDRELDVMAAQLSDRIYGEGKYAGTAAQDQPIENAGQLLRDALGENRVEELRKARFVLFRYKLPSAVDLDYKPESEKDDQFFPQKPWRALMLLHEGLKSDILMIDYAYQTLSASMGKARSHYFADDVGFLPHLNTQRTMGILFHQFEIEMPDNLPQAPSLFFVAPNGYLDSSPLDPNRKSSTDRTPQSYLENSVFSELLANKTLDVYRERKAEKKRSDLRGESEESPYKDIVWATARNILGEFNQEERSALTLNDLWQLTRQRFMEADVELRSETAKRKPGALLQATGKKSALVSLADAFNEQFGGAGGLNESYPEDVSPKALIALLKRMAVMDSSLKAGADKASNTLINFTAVKRRLVFPSNYTGSIAADIYRAPRAMRAAALVDRNDPTNAVVFFVSGNRVFAAHGTDASAHEILPASEKSPEIRMLNDAAFMAFDSRFLRPESYVDIKGSNDQYTSIGFGGSQIYVNFDDGPPVLARRLQGKRYEQYRSESLIYENVSADPAIPLLTLQTYPSEAGGFIIEGLNWRKGGDVRPLVIVPNTSSTDSGVINLNRIVDLVRSGELQTLLERYDAVPSVSPELLDERKVPRPKYLGFNKARRKVSLYDVRDNPQDSDNPIRLFPSGTFIGYPGSDADEFLRSDLRDFRRDFNILLSPQEGRNVMTVAGRQFVIPPGPRELVKTSEGRTLDVSFSHYLRTLYESVELDLMHLNVTSSYQVHVEYRPEGINFRLKIAGEDAASHELTFENLRSEEERNTGIIWETNRALLYLPAVFDETSQRDALYAFFHHQHRHEIETLETIITTRRSDLRAGKYGFLFPNSKTSEMVAGRLDSVLRRTSADESGLLKSDVVNATNSELKRLQKMSPDQLRKEAHSRIAAERRVRSQSGFGYFSDWTYSTLNEMLQGLLDRERSLDRAAMSFRNVAWSPRQQEFVSGMLAEAFAYEQMDFRFRERRSDLRDFHEEFTMVVSERDAENIFTVGGRQFVLSRDPKKKVTDLEGNELDPLYSNYIKNLFSAALVETEGADRNAFFHVQVRYEADGIHLTYNLDGEIAREDIEFDWLRSAPVEEREELWRGDRDFIYLPAIFDEKTRDRALYAYGLNQLDHEIDTLSQIASARRSDLRGFREDFTVLVSEQEKHDVLTVGGRSFMIAHDRQGQTIREVGGAFLSIQEDFFIDSLYSFVMSHSLNEKGLRPSFDVSLKYRPEGISFAVKIDDTPEFEYNFVFEDLKEGVDEEGESFWAEYRPLIYLPAISHEETKDYGLHAFMANILVQEVRVFERFINQQHSDFREFRQNFNMVISDRDDRAAFTVGGRLFFIPNNSRDPVTAEDGTALDPVFERLILRLYRAVSVDMNEESGAYRARVRLLDGGISLTVRNGGDLQYTHARFSDYVVQGYPVDSRAWENYREFFFLPLVFDERTREAALEVYDQSFSQLQDLSGLEQILEPYRSDLREPGPDEEKTLDKSKIFQNDPDFFGAVDYFNEDILNASIFENRIAPLAWDELVGIYERLRGDVRDDQIQLPYSAAERKLRLSHAESDWTSEWLNQVNGLSDDPADVLQNAVEIYWQTAEGSTQWQQFVGKAGFTKVLSTSLIDSKRDHPANGRHRLAWFLMNFYLLRNGYRPFYFSSEKQYTNIPINYWNKTEGKQRLTEYLENQVFRSDLRELPMTLQGLSVQERLDVAKYVLEELRKEKAVQGSGHLPEANTISDQHGEVGKLDDYILDTIKRSLPTNLKSKLPKDFAFKTIDFEKKRFLTLEEQLTPFGISLRDLKGRVFFENIGDFADRGPEGIKVAWRSQELVEAGLSTYVIGNHDLYMMLSLLGYHLPFYDNYNFYGDEEAERLYEEHKEVRGDKDFWASKLKDFMTFQKTEQKKRWSSFDKVVREDLYPRALAGRDELPEPHEALWGKFRGFYLVDVNRGTRAVGMVSIRWWKQLLEAFEAVYENEDGSLPGQEAWKEAIDMMRNEIIPALEDEKAKRIKAGEWWWPVLDSIFYKNYISSEYYGLDWVFHGDKKKGWGPRVLAELNEIIAVEAGIDVGELDADEIEQMLDDRAVTQANYLDHPVLTSIVSFYRKNFNLYTENIYGNKTLHGFLPVYDADDPVKVAAFPEVKGTAKSGQIIFRYKDKVYVGKGDEEHNIPSIWEGFDRISADVRNTENELSDLKEALQLVTGWYADDTTESKPKQIVASVKKAGGSKAFAELNGFNRLITGHVPILAFAKLLKSDEGDWITGALVDEIFGFSDRSWAEAYGYWGGGLIANRNGFYLRGWKDKSTKELTNNPDTILIEKGPDSPFEVMLFHNRGIDREKFLDTVISEYEKLIPELEKKVTEKRSDLRGGAEDLSYVKQNWDELGPVSIHGQLLADASGSGLVILGEPFAGKSALTVDLLKSGDKFRIAADDEFELTVYKGRIYAQATNSYFRELQFRTSPPGSTSPRFQPYPVPGEKQIQGVLEVGSLLRLSKGEVKQIEVRAASINGAETFEILKASRRMDRSPAAFDDLGEIFPETFNLWDVEVPEYHDAYQPFAGIESLIETLSAPQQSGSSAAPRPLPRKGLDELFKYRYGFYQAVADYAYSDFSEIDQKTLALGETPVNANPFRIVLLGAYVADDARGPVDYKLVLMTDEESPSIIGAVSLEEAIDYTENKLQMNPFGNEDLTGGYFVIRSDVFSGYRGQGYMQRAVTALLLKGAITKWIPSASQEDPSRRMYDRMKADERLAVSGNDRRVRMVEAAKRSDLRVPLSAPENASPVNVRSSLEKTGHLPARLFISYEEIKGDDNALYDDLFAVGYLTKQHRETQIVVYGVPTNEMMNKRVTELRKGAGIATIQGDFAKAWQLYGQGTVVPSENTEKRHSVHLSMQASRLREQMSDEVIPFLATKDHDIFAALLLARAGGRMPGVRKDEKSGFYSVTENFLAEELLRYQANLVVEIAA